MKEPDDHARAKLASQRNRSKVSQKRRRESEDDNSETEVIGTNSEQRCRSDAELIEDD
jgi:hypothetical protein